jgi:hypothetical protein
MSDRLLKAGESRVSALLKSKEQELHRVRTKVTLIGQVLMKIELSWRTH